MKKVVCLSGLLILAGLIVLPVSNSLNSDISKPVVADGSPLPWPVPPFPPSSTTLVADGSPLPWPVPPFPPASATLVADGSPLPWPVPPFPPQTSLAA